MNTWIVELNAFTQGWLAGLWRASWQGGLAVLLVWGITRAPIRLSAKVKVWLWRLAYFKLLSAFFWATPIDLAVLPAPPMAVATAARAKEITPGSLPTRLAPNRPHLATETHTLPSLASGLFGLWLLGLLTGSGRFFCHWRRANSLRRNARPVNDAALNQEYRALAVTLAIKTPPILCETTFASVPLLAGTLRPFILLPTAVVEHFPPEQIRFILAHELAHLKRRDLAWMKVLWLAEMLFFFHPLLWLTRRDWHLASEMACDELVLRATRGAASDYGTMLLDVVSRSLRDFPAQSVLGVGIIETKQTLQRRLIAMKNLNLNSPQRMALAFSTLILLGAIGILPWRVVAQNSDNKEEIARLKVENAKLKAELKRAGPGPEAIRQPSTTLEDAVGKSQAQEKLKDPVKSDAIEKLRARLTVERGVLAHLWEIYSADHPAVVSREKQFISLQKELETLLDSKDDLPPQDTRPTAKAKVSAEQRTLLRADLELAEAQADHTRKRFEAGVTTVDELLRVERELFDSKEELATLESNKTEQKELVQAEIKLVEQALTGVIERVKVGVLPTGSDIPLRREILRLKRLQILLESPSAERVEH